VSVGGPEQVEVGFKLVPAFVRKLRLVWSGDGERGKKSDEACTPQSAEEMLEFSTCPTQVKDVINRYRREEHCKTKN